jgi:two-component system CheB/CheR fusion protein
VPSPPPEVDPAFEALLDYIRDNRGFDFTGYKRASLARRISKRMHEVGIEAVGAYQDYLEVHPEEFTHLFNTILINVTSFFRDTAAWDYVAQEVVPRVLERKAAPDHVRVWSAGCASGEEAYTIAMVLAEHVGLARMIERVKIYATDLDEDALAQARAGAYAEKGVDAIPLDFREKYLERANDRFTFRTELRRAVIFGRHDLVKDAPISRVDLIACRNTLMYFNAEVQSRIYNGFHFALAPHGYLLLGKSEMLLTRTTIFEPADLRRRVFVRVPGSGERAVRPSHAAAGDESQDGPLHAAVFESATVAQIALDAGDAVVAANGRARAEFNLDDADLGRPFRELSLSYKPAELRSRIERALSERNPNLERAVPWLASSGDERFLDIEVIPLIAGSERLGTTITFTDVSHSHGLQAELERSRLELEAAYEELQSTVEELETTNEELQSTNEELETTNEELQSTNEELETMNEELRSTNEELETINIELRDRTSELNRANVFMESMLGSVRAGVVALDRELTIESWNHRAEDLWGLRPDEAKGRNLFGLDIGLPMEKLRPSIRDCLGGNVEFAETTVDATNRRGRSFRCKVVCSPMRFRDEQPHGVILLMEAAEG